MDVRPCKICKRLFNHVAGPPICPACTKQLEKKFKEVREFIRENPKATLQEVSDANEVSVKQLKNWVREERLTFSDDSPVGLECLNCGTMIKCGKYCDRCKGKMLNNLSQMEDSDPDPVVEPKQAGGNKMRFLDS